jgi:hypothetical protein
VGPVEKRALTVASVLDEKERCAQAINKALDDFVRATGCHISDLVVVKTDQNGIQAVGLRVEIF